MAHVLDQPKLVVGNFYRRKYVPNEIYIYAFERVLVNIDGGNCFTRPTRQRYDARCFGKITPKGSQKHQWEDITDLVLGKQT